MTDLSPRWWQAEAAPKDHDQGTVYHCGLCFHQCRIPAGGWGYCGARGVDESGFISPCLGHFSSCAVDPIEKKPLFHWRPGTRIFSLGSLGCTMHCPFCQNHGIARPDENSRPEMIWLSPEDLRAKVGRMGLLSVAYTYNEPILQAEYILAAAPGLKELGIATVLVTNGMFSPEALADLIPVIDAANVDLKTFNPLMYAKLGGSLEAVKSTVAHLCKAGIHVELTTLVVPGISDDPDEFIALADWVASVSPDIPLHISRYFPAHQYTAPPTDLVLLRRFQELAKARLRHVHLGNVS